MRGASHLEVAGAAVAALLLAAAVAVAVGGCGSVQSAADARQSDASSETGENVGGHGGAQLGGGGGQQASGGAGGGAGSVSVDANDGGAVDGLGDGADAGCEAGTGQSCVAGHLCMLSLGDAWIKCAACPGGGAHAQCGGTRWCCVTPPPAPTGVPWCADVVGCAVN